MMAARFDLDPIGQGLSWALEFSYLRTDGLNSFPIDLSSWLATLRFRGSDGLVALEVSEANNQLGTLVNGGIDGSIAASLSTLGSSRLPAGKCTFELDIQNTLTGYTVRVLDGFVPVVRPGGRVVTASRNVTIAQRQDIAVVDTVETVSVRIVERNSLFGGGGTGGGTSDQVVNKSNVTGGSVTDALNALKAAMLVPAPAALTDADQSVAVAGSAALTIFECNAAARNVAITLSAAGASNGQRIQFRQMQNVAFSWTFTGAGGDSIVVPSGTRGVVDFALLGGVFKIYGATGSLT